MTDQSTGIEPQSPLANLSGLLFLALVFALAAMAAAFLSGWWAALGIGSLVFLAAFAVGCALGFLFGVPRVLSRDNATVVAAPAPVAAAGTPTSGASPPPAPAIQAPVLQSNTNLERISDWLTTMIVGATLVEVNKFNDMLVDFRLFLAANAKVFTTGTGAGAVASAGVIPTVGPLILIVGAVAGFLFMYLNTRLILIRLFFETEEFLAGRERRREFLAGPGQTLTRDTSKQIRTLVSNTGLAGVAARLQRGALSVQGALDLMRSALYRDDGYRDAINIGATLSDTVAPTLADYWFLMAAAFGQAYSHATSDEDKMSARDNAVDSARRALSIDPSYGLRLKALTDPQNIDNDLAALYAAEDDGRELRRLLP